jgi:hypothetical protein
MSGMIPIALKARSYLVYAQIGPIANKIFSKGTEKSTTQTLRVAR